MRTIVRLSLVVCLLAVSMAVAADVEYQLGPATELLDAAFYAGEPGDGSDVAGRMAFIGRASSDGETVAFWAVNANTFRMAVFLVDIGNPSSWGRLTNDFPSTPTTFGWAPNDAYIFAYYYRVPLSTGGLIEHTLHGFALPTEAFSTRLPNANWLLMYDPPEMHGGDLMAVPILSDGSEDLTREPVVVTNLGAVGLNPDNTYVAPDGSALCFLDYHGSDGVVPDIGDIYVVKNLTSIINAPKVPSTDISSLAPSALDDPNLIAIRTSESGNFTAVPVFSEDMSLVFYAEDWNNEFINDRFFETVPLSDFDVMISNADGSGEDIRLAEPGNQALTDVTLGGARLIYTKDVSGVMHLYITTLEVGTDLAGDTVGDPANNDIVTTTDQQASDASGTVVEIDSGTIIDFPVGFTQEIQIWTPIDPATEPEVPDGVDAIPVIREFGPSGTTFSPPVTVTITYTDAQVAGMDEPNLRVFRYNSVTSKYDIEVTTIFDRDLVNNTISFTVTSFSKYGLAAVVDTDGDGLTDDVDTDDDNDGLLDGSDPYPLDTDNDGTDNADDWDDDRDGIPDGDDPYPLDTDNDGSNNADDDDDDGDGILDSIDAYLFDTDNDGEMNDDDEDDDNDGYSDAEEMAAGTDPLDSEAFPLLTLSFIGLVLLSFSLMGLGRRQLTVKRA